MLISDRKYIIPDSMVENPGNNNVLPNYNKVNKSTINLIY